MATTEAIIYIDGASRGNPGPAASAVVVKDSEGAPLGSFAKLLGNTTNNVAEYQSLIEALDYALEHNYIRLQIVTDSELLARQIGGHYQVRNPNLKLLYEQARQMIRQFESFTIRHVLREQNTEADALANKTLDAAQGKGAAKGNRIGKPGLLFSAADQNAGLKASATNLLQTSATYRDGRLEPDSPLPLAEGEIVQIEIRRQR